jgi:uroporphyrin-III C-methyltransferase
MEIDPKSHTDRKSAGPENRLALRRLAETFSLPRLEGGWVWLAGAGPGEPGLASLLTLSAIAEAEIIMSDALVGEKLLLLARHDAEIIGAGKRAGRPSPKQELISRQLIGYARKGLKVLRLKGGDPFVFGRGGEEALALARAAIPFRVVPGVSAGTGALAYAGIPLTHRETNHAVTFLTGTGADGKIPDFNWKAISEGSPTLVFYMARRQAGEIAAKLIDAGRSPAEPAAIISSGTLSDQATMLTVLAELGPTAAQADTPAIIVIGENVRLSAGLDWLGAALDGRVLDSDPLRNNPLQSTG